MSKEFPDRHPKLKGDHGLLPKFRHFYEKLQDDPEIIRIIPHAPKRVKEFSLPEARWKKEIKPQNIHLADKPTGQITLIYGALSQVVTLHAASIEPLRSLGFSF